MAFTDKGPWVYKGITYTRFVGTDQSENFQDQGTRMTLVAGLGGNDTIILNAGNDVGFGDAGNDDIDGGSGNDELWGLEDDDNLKGGGGTDTLYGGTGNDYLQAGSNVNGTSPDYLEGGPGNDNLRDSGGYSYLVGGADNDTYYVSNSNTAITELDGVDNLHLGVEGKTIPSGIEYTHLDTGIIGVTGNSEENIIYGNELGNRISAVDGTDYLYGLAGTDTLIGGSGDDQVNGAEGIDTLTGGSGKDTFNFQYALDGKERDTITDYSVANDTITVYGYGGGTKYGVLPSADFRVGSRALDSSDRFIYNRSTGILSFDIDGSGSQSPFNVAKLPTNLSLNNNDIFVFG